jgi:DNA-binding GntR family transcriptional regulator
MYTSQAHERVEEVIIDKVLSGEMKPGDSISHSRLAEQLGVSNNPVIHALRRLEGLGILEQTPSGSSRVKPFTLREVIAVMALREGLEGIAARFCAQFCSDEELAVLQVRAGKLDARLSEGSLAVDEEIAFHSGVVEFAHTPYLSSVHKGLMLTHTALCSRWMDFARGAGVGTHREIMDAIQLRDGKLAESAMRQHLHTARRRLEEHYLEKTDPQHEDVSDLK